MGGAYERGRAVWPELVVDPAQFAAHVAAVGGDEEHAEDLYLAFACAVGDAKALAAFDARYLSQVPRYIARVVSSPALAEEVQQILRTEVLVGPPGQRPQIAGYSGRGPLAGWLRVLAVRRVHRLRRRKIDSAPTEELVVDRLVAAGPTPELALVKARHGADLALAIKRAIAALPARERNLIKLHVIDELTIDDLCQLYNVHRSTVARWIVRLKQQLLDEAVGILRSQLGLETEEIESLCRAVRSQLDLSLSGLDGD
jgi:RNA polymerase sigma-70 factor (ECF subfamily)